jgi:hypothetical protein
MMKTFTLSYSLLGEGEYYSRRIAAETDEQARNRLERLLELLGQDPDDIDMFEIEEV